MENLKERGRMLRLIAKDKIEDRQLAEFFKRNNEVNLFLNAFNQHQEM